MNSNNKKPHPNSFVNFLSEKIRQGEKKFKQIINYKKNSCHNALFSKKFGNSYQHFFWL